VKASWWRDMRQRSLVGEDLENENQFLHQIGSKERKMRC